MPRGDEFSRRNLQVASDLIARQFEVRDEYLLGQPYYMDLMTYIVDTLGIVLPLGARVLEVSCGTGILAELLLERLDDVALDVSDISGETLKLVKRRTKRFGNRVGLVKKDNATYSFSGQYDAIVTTNAMRLTFVDYTKLYRNFHDVLKGNGIVLIGEAVVQKQKRKSLRRIGANLNDVKTKPGSDQGWDDLADSQGFVEKVDREDIGRVVNFYTPAFHIEKLKSAGFGEADVIYMKYHHAIIAGLKGRLSFYSRPS